MLENHRHDVKKIQEELIEWIQERNLSESTEHITLANKKQASNTLRGNKYKSKGLQLGLDSLNRVLKVDAGKKIALVEPRVTMEQLVDATLPYGLVPPVLPEFKSITVGGAINGAALESTSHKYGQFNDICNSYELLLGDGAIITATRQEYSDLFYAMAGSYGSLAVILAVEVQLVPAKPWVLLEFQKMHSIGEVVIAIRRLHNELAPPEYLEGIVYSKRESIVISGSGVDEEDLPPSVPRLSLKHSWSGWFYQTVVDNYHRGVEKAAIPIRDYLFRHDRAAFWMGGYALHPLLLLRYLIEYFGQCPEKLDKWLMVKMAKQYTVTRRASWLFRFLFGWMMDSSRLYSIMHHGTEEWFSRHFAIQDYHIPEEATADFTTYISNAYEIFPLWLCPIKPTNEPQFFSPHSAAKEGSALLFDVGVYGLPKDMTPGESVVYDLDKLAYALHGKKMFYSHTYFVPEEFWRLYPKKTYEKLREKYLAKGTFLDITEKILNG